MPEATGSISRRFRELRERPGLSENEAGQQMGVSVWDIEAVEDEIGYISNGSVLDRAKLKSPRSGYQWTRKVGQRTVTVAMSADQFEAMKQAVRNGRSLRKAIRAMEALSRQILFTTTQDTPRFKPLKTKDLRLI